MNNSTYFSSFVIVGFSTNATSERRAAQRATECAIRASEWISVSLSDAMKFSVNFDAANCVALIEKASCIKYLIIDN